MKHIMDTKEVKPRVKRGLWKPEEDMTLKIYVETYGEGNWATVSKKSGLNRGGKSCRLRWKNYLRPNIKRGAMSEEEQDLIIRMHKLLGNRWSLIAGRLPGRTDNEVKNYWNTHLSKKLHQGRRKSIELNAHCNAHEDNDKNKRLPPLCDAQQVPSANAVEMTKDEKVGTDISLFPEKEDGNNGNLKAESLTNFATETHVRTQDSGFIFFEDELSMPFWASLPFFEAPELNPEETFWQVDVQSVFPEFANSTVSQD